MLNNSDTIIATGKLQRWNTIIKDEDEGDAGKVELQRWMNVQYSEVLSYATIRTGRILHTGPVQAEED